MSWPERERTLGIRRSIAAHCSFTADPIKGSRFVADAVPATDEAEAMALISSAKERWPGASHHCFAWRLADGGFRASDDGEPGGSAGRPILAQIDGHGLVDVAVVVVRWFGGTKLGVGGLIRAYGGTAGRLLDRADVVEHVIKLPLEVRHGYAQTSAVKTVIVQEGLEVSSSDYSESVTMRLLVREEDLERIRQRLIDATGDRIELG